jgi:hypothetical protein
MTCPAHFSLINLQNFTMPLDVDTGLMKYASKSVTLCLTDEGGVTRVCVKVL